MIGRGRTAEFLEVFEYAEANEPPLEVPTLLAEDVWYSDRAGSSSVKLAFLLPSVAFKVS